MKRLLLFLLLALPFSFASADDFAIALLQPLTVKGSTACNAMEISIVRGELRKALIWQSGSQVVTRLDVDAMLKEQGFQQSGMVNDAQRKKVGDMTGAQYICVSTITKYGTQLYIEAYLVDVETGQMHNPATQYANVTNEDYSTLPASCNALAEEMLGEISGSRKKVQGIGKSPRSSVGQDFTETAWGINMKMVWVEGGDFMMGCTSEQSDCGNNEQNVRRVMVDGFYIGMLEVTQAQWQAVMGTSIYQQWVKAINGSPTKGVGGDYPMYCVSWDEAMEFCRLLSNKTGKTYTLPTEAQWEYAARGGNRPDGTKYAGSNMIDGVAWYYGNSDGSNPCGTKRANALGLYDMSGNVWEWCKDWYSYPYLSYDTNNPAGPSSGSHRVTRGGSWFNNALNCRVATRDYYSPDDREFFLGFRVVCIP